MSTENLGAAASEGAAGTYEEADKFRDAFDTIVNPKGMEKAQSEAEKAVDAFVVQALAGQSTLEGDLMDQIAQMTAMLDEKLTAQINKIMHHDDFQQLESAWRGVQYLVNSANPDATAKVKVLNVSKDEIREMFASDPTAPLESLPLYDKIYSQEYNMLGGNPYGVLIGDYQFDHSDEDVSILTKMGELAMAAHAPFIASAAPSLMGFSDISEIAQAPNLDNIMTGAAYSGWNGLRKMDQARYIALTGPNLMGRSPYAPGSANQVSDFNFVEDVNGHENDNYSWMNSAFALGANIVKAHKEHGWTVQIRGVQSGGKVESLPMHQFETGEGMVDVKCPTQVAIDNDREKQMSNHGMIGLQHIKNTNTAAFIGAQSLYSPTKRQTAADTASDQLSARLPYMFAVSRFSHYLKMMIHNMVGETKEHEQLQRQLQSWISQYVPANPATADAAEKGRKPLAAAKIEILPDEENPGYYSARCELRPHFQLEGMTIGMTLVSKMSD